MSQTVETTPDNSFVGQVKWFNNRLGYGFITIISQCGRQNEDVFVHQQHITPKTSEYRSLQQGEYVSFQLGKADAEGEGSKHDNQAVKVTGVFGGSLMCDQTVRRAPPATESSTEQSDTQSKPTTRPGFQSRPANGPNGRTNFRGNGRGNGTSRPRNTQ
jgi:cold shock CspA family protein